MIRPESVDLNAIEAASSYVSNGRYWESTQKRNRYVKNHIVLATSLDGTVTRTENNFFSNTGLTHRASIMRQAATDIGPCPPVTIHRTSKLSHKWLSFVSFMLDFALESPEILLVVSGQRFVSREMCRFCQCTWITCEHLHHSHFCCKIMAPLPCAHWSCRGFGKFASTITFCKHECDQQDSCFVFLLQLECTLILH